MLQGRSRLREEHIVLTVRRNRLLLRHIALFFIVPAALLAVFGCGREPQRSVEHRSPDGSDQVTASDTSVHSQGSVSDESAQAGEVAGEPVQSGAQGSEPSQSGAAVSEPAQSGATVSEPAQSGTTASKPSASGQSRVQQIIDQAPKFERPALPPAKDRPIPPKLELVDMNGRTLKLEDLRGQVVLLAFWATWCGPCRMEIPSLIHMTQIYKDAGFAIVAPSIDRNGMAAVKPFVERNKEINYTIVPNGVPASMAFGGIRSIPTSFLIDRQGRILRSFVGLQPPEVLEAYVQAALLEKG